MGGHAGRLRGWRWHIPAVALGCLIVLTAAPAGRPSPVGQSRCRPKVVGRSYRARVERALGQGRDLWGDRLLETPGGPTLARTRRLLPPLLYAVGHGGRRLTDSGVYYLPFTMPYSKGDRGFALHVADGSQIISRRVGGPSMRVFVGARGFERYGSCLERLQTPRLEDGYPPLPDRGYPHPPRRRDPAPALFDPPP